MFKVLMRGLVGWSSGFGRYLDLMLATVLLVLGYVWSQPWLLVGGVVAGAAFALDANGRFQRWMMNGMLAKVGNR